MEPIISREVIARLADNAAARWAKSPTSPKPTCPFDEHLQPEAFKAWRATFERYLLLHSAPTAEASA
jgi:hypothetical protein